VKFRYFDLMTPLPDAVSTLNDFAPDLIVAPPSLLLALADAAKSGTLTARPERLVSVAETLEAHDRAALEAAFGVPVGQVYQCTEGFLAATCEHGSLHVNEDLVAVQYEPLAEGRVTPIVTDLWRRTQPIIRYRLGDVLMLDDMPCPCESGFQEIAAVAVRCDDVCYFTDGAGKPRRFYPDQKESTVLFGDGAAAAALIRTPDGEPSALHLARFTTLGSGAVHTTFLGAGSLHHPNDDATTSSMNQFDMNGTALFLQATRAMGPFSDRFFAELGTSRRAFPHVVPHQVSGPGIDMLHVRLGFCASQVVRNIETRGNCVAASLPIALSEAAHSGRIRRGEPVLLVGTGAGLTLGAVALTY